jgi:hypothetical protein
LDDHGQRDGLAQSLLGCARSERAIQAAAFHAKRLLLFRVATRVDACSQPVPLTANKEEGPPERAFRE